MANKNEQYQQREQQRMDNGRGKKLIGKRPERMLYTYVTYIYVFEHVQTLISAK